MLRIMFLFVRNCLTKVSRPLVYPIPADMRVRLAFELEWCDKVVNGDPPNTNQDPERERAEIGRLCA
jgi:hypothetical protein